MELITDALPWGLSATLSRVTPGNDDCRVIAYISRSLIEVERKYSPTEHEVLGIVWAMEQLHIYLLGGKFMLYTDCKPIEMILGNPKSKPHAHIEHWNLRIQDFDFNIVFKKGCNYLSDFLSRHPCEEINKLQETAAENYVNFLTTHTMPKAMTY